MNADHILAGIDCAIFDPSLVVSLRKLLVGLAVSGNLRTTAVGTVASSPVEMPSSDSLPIEPSELPAAGMTVEQFVRLGSIAELKKGETGIQKATPGRFPLVVTAQQRATTDHYDFDGPSAIVPLVSSTGHGKASLHRLHYQDGQYAVGNILAAIFPRSGSGITARFLYEYLSAFKDELLVTRMTGTANVALTIGRLKEVPVPIVSPRCQEVVDELMALCDRLEAAQAEREARRDRLVSASLARVTEAESDDVTFRTTSARFHLDHLARLTTRPEHVKQLRQTILNLAVRGRLVPPDPSDEPALDALIRRGLRTTQEQQPVDLPPGWCCVHFEDVAVVSGGVTLGRKLGSRKTVSLPYLRVANVKRGHFDLAVVKEVEVAVDEVEKYSLRRDDLLMTEGGDWDKVGRAAIWQGQVPVCLHQNHVFRARMRSPEISPRWCEMYFNSPVGRSYFEDASKQTTNLASINMRQVRGCPVPLPPLAEQRRIVAKVDELMALCDQLEASLACAATDRARLLEALLHEALAPAA